MAVSTIEEKKRSLEELLSLQPENLSARLELFKMHITEENYDDALEHLDIILEAQPNNINNLLLKANVLTTAEKFDQAIDVYKQLITLAPDDFRLKQELAKVYETMEDYEQALTLYEECFENWYSKDVNLNYTYIMDLANVYHLAGYTQDAIEHYELCLKHQPNDSMALLQLSELYESYDKKKFHLYKAMLARSDSDIERAITEYRKAVKYAESHEEEAEIRLEIGILYFMIEKLHQAIDEFNFAKQFKEDFRLYKGLGCCFYELEEYEAAQDMLEKALELVVKDESDQYSSAEVENIYVDLADIYLELGDHHKALETYTQITQISESRQDEYLLKMARLYIQTGQAQEAKNLLQPSDQKAQKAGSHTGENLELMMDIALSENNSEALERTFQHYIKLFPDDPGLDATPTHPDAQRVKAKYYQAKGDELLYHYYTGLACEAENNLEEALNAYTDASQLEDANPRLLFKLGMIHGQLKNKPIALEYFLRAQELDKNNLTICLNIAELYKDYGDKEKVYEYCEHMLSINPHHSYSLFQMAVFYDNTKEYETALEYYQKYAAHPGIYKAQLSFATVRIEQLQAILEGAPDPSSLINKFIAFLKNL